MKARKYTEEQIIAMLREGEAGAKVAELCRKHGMSDATYYNWKAKYVGLTVSELKRLKGLEYENCRLKQIVADQGWISVPSRNYSQKTSEAQGEASGGLSHQGEPWAE